MALFGRNRDISMFRKVNNELIDRVITQECDYYKLYLPETKANDTANVYGEGSAQKTYYQAVRVTCLIERSDIASNQDDQFGIDISQPIVFRFLRPKLEELGLVPQVGDVIEQRGSYYEVDNVNDNQFIMGRDQDYPKSHGETFGRNWSIICTTHLARITRLQITKGR